MEKRTPVEPFCIIAHRSAGICYHAGHRPTVCWVYKKILSSAILKDLDTILLDDPSWIMMTAPAWETVSLSKAMLSSVR